MESRGHKYHRERLGEALREEIETILEGELADPRIGLAAVSNVALAEDSRSARVFVTVEGDDAEAARTLEGLNAAVGFVRREVAERLHLRRPPELYFQVDRSGQYVNRIDELLNRSNKRNKQNGPRCSKAPYAG
ncbi:MAG: ribosome-binding factor A [Terriglobales bacterium]